MSTNTLKISISGYKKSTLEFDFTDTDLNRKIKYDFLTKYKGIKEKKGIEILDRYKEGDTYIVRDFIHDVISQLITLHDCSVTSKANIFGKSININFSGSQEHYVYNILTILFGYLKHSANVNHDVPVCEILVHTTMEERKQYLDMITKSMPSKRAYVFTAVQDGTLLTIVWLTNFIGYDFRYKCSVATYTLNDKLITDYKVDLRELETLTGVMRNYVKNDKAKDVRQPLDEKDDKQLQDELVLHKDTLYYFNTEDNHALRVVAHSVLQHQTSYYIFRYQSHLLVVISNSINISLQDYISKTENMNVVSSIIYQSDVEGNKTYGRSFSFNFTTSMDKKQFIAFVRKLIKEQTSVVLVN